MFRIELTDEKAEFLREILGNHLSQLRMEIAHTDRKDFREFLRKRGQFLEEFLQNLEKEFVAQGKETISIDRIRNVDIFKDLTDWELKSVSQFFREENFPEGITLCEEGEMADRLFILEQGAVSIKFKRGGQHEIRTPGQIVGWSFLVPPNRYTASAVTIAPSMLLVINSPDFYYVIHQEPKIGLKVMDNLAQVVASRMMAQEGNLLKN